MATTQFTTVTVTDTTKEIFRASEVTVVTVIKNTSGQIAIGTGADLAPPSSGRGGLVPVEIPVTFYLFPGDILSACGSTTLESLTLITHPPLPQAAGGGGGGGAQGGFGAAGRLCQ